MNITSINIEMIASVAHEVNRSYCKSVNDNSQVSWSEASEWQRKSSVEGVKFFINNSNVSPTEMHNSWLREKALEGWKYGVKKDSELKTHPCFVDYQDLPKEQQTKDHLFIAVCKAMVSNLTVKE